MEAKHGVRVWMHGGPDQKFFRFLGLDRYVEANPETPGQCVLPILDECGVEVRTPECYGTEPDAEPVRANIDAAVEWLENPAPRLSAKPAHKASPSIFRRGRLACPGGS